MTIEPEVAAAPESGAKTVVPVGYVLAAVGARIGLPEHFEHGVGALVRLYFPNTPGPMVLFAEIKRMALDHVVVEFAEGQHEQVNQLFGELLATED